MQCRNCGTEIADKAIVCYRCGTATTDPVRRPASMTPRRLPILSVGVLVVLTILAAVIGQASTTAADPQPLQLAAGLCVGAAAAVLFFRFLRRR
jgi:hypothetical protein